MTHIPRSNCNDGGFTLLELLIAITVLGLLLVALANGARFAGQAWETQARRIDRQGDLGAVQNVLRQLISSSTGLTGTDLSLKFVGSLPLALGRGGLYDIKLLHLDGRLVLLWKPHFKGPAETVQESVTELANGVTSLELAYYMPGTGWQRTSSNEKPALVRIVMALNSGRSWRTLVVAPMVDVQRMNAYVDADQ